MFKVTKLAASIGVAVFAFSVGAAQATRIDPLGGAGLNAVDVANLGWNNGNSLSAPITTTNGTVKNTAVGDVIQAYGQAKLQGLSDIEGNTLSIAGFDPNRWSYVFGFAEEVTSANDSGTDSGRVFRSLSSASGANYFEIWVGGDAASDLTGRGFQGDGGATRILWGTVNAYDPLTGDGQTNFDSSSATLQDLDKFLPNNYTNYKTVTGTGGGKIDVTVLGQNFNYFLDTLTSIDILLVTDTFQNLPFAQVNPSSCFWNGSAYIAGAGNGIVGGCGVAGDGGTIGVVANGLYDGTARYTNTQFQTRATTALPVPEPGTLVLLGIGLLGAAVGRRRA